jgi:hypothetical protein
MATRVKFRKWDGGDSLHDTIIPLCECRESPQEVLKLLFRQHYIYSYKGVTQPVDKYFPNNAEGLIIEEIPEGEYPAALISEHGLSIHALDLTKLRGYDEKIGRSPETLGESLKALASKCFDPKMFYEWIEPLQPLAGKNYLMVRHTDVVLNLRTKTSKIEWSYPNNAAGRPIVPADLIAELEKQVDLLLEIAQITIGAKSIEDMTDIYVRYNK